MLRSRVLTVVLVVAAPAITPGVVASLLFGGVFELHLQSTFLNFPTSIILQVDLSRRGGEQRSDGTLDETTGRWRGPSSAAQGGGWRARVRGDSQWAGGRLGFARNRGGRDRRGSAGRLVGWGAGDDGPGLACPSASTAHASWRGAGMRRDERGLPV